MEGEVSREELVRHRHVGACVRFMFNLDIERVGLSVDPLHGHTYNIRLR